MKFAGLVKMEDIREQAGIPIKIKLFLLHVIVITHLQEGRREEGKGKEEIMSKKNEKGRMIDGGRRKEP